jgi:hypothetical protein
MSGEIALDRLDPNKTALVVVHMVKGVAGEVDTPFNRLFRSRAKEKGVITAQLRLLDRFRRAKAAAGPTITYSFEHRRISCNLKKTTSTLIAVSS